MALKKRESIFQTWTDGGEVNDSTIKDILSGVTGDKAPEGKSLKHSRGKFSTAHKEVKEDVYDDKGINLFVLENINPFSANYFKDSRGDKSLRSPDFYDKYLEKEKLPSVIACDYIYDFCKNNFDALEKESKNYGSLKTRFTHDKTYIENLRSYINDVILFSEALRNISTKVSSADSNGFTLGYYLELYNECLDWAQSLDIKLRTNSNANFKTTEISNTNTTNAAECFMFLSMLKASCEAFSELSKKIEVIRTKFNKIFNKASNLQKKFDDSHVNQELEVADNLEREAGYLPEDSKTVKVGKKFHKKGVVLSSVSFSQYTGKTELDPEHNINHKCFEICKKTIVGLTKECYESLAKKGPTELRDMAPACFDNLLNAEKDGFCIDYVNFANYFTETQLSESKTIFDSLETIIQPFVDKGITKDKVDDDFTIDEFECKDPKKFLFAVDQLRRSMGGALFTCKYELNDKKEQKNDLTVTLNTTELKTLLTNFKAAIEDVNTLLDSRDKFLSNIFSKTWVLDKAIVKDVKQVSSGKVTKNNRKLDDDIDKADTSIKNQVKNVAKKARNALVKDILCDVMEKIIKKRGKLPETADRRVFPSLDTYDFIAVDEGGKEIKEANHDGSDGSTISEETGIKDAKTIALAIYHLAVMSRAYGYWANLDNHEWTKYEADMKNRYVDFKDPFRA